MFMRIHIPTGLRSTSGYTYIVSLPICIPYGYNSRDGSHSYSYSCSYVFFYL